MYFDSRFIGNKHTGNCYKTRKSTKSERKANMRKFLNKKCGRK